MGISFSLKGDFIKKDEVFCQSSPFPSFHTGHV